MDVVLVGLLGIALLGLFASGIAHAASLFGIALTGLESYLFPALFLVMVPTVILSNHLSADFPSKDTLKASLRGAPSWAGRAIQAIGIYAIVNFILLFGAPNNDVTKIRLSSGHGALFFAAAAGTIYSAWRLRKTDVDRRCVQGHIVSPAAQFCEKCGSPVPDSGPHIDPAS